MVKIFVLCFLLSPFSFAKEKAKCRSENTVACVSGEVKVIEMLKGCKVSRCVLPNKAEICPSLAIMCKEGEEVFLADPCKQICVVREK